MGALFCRQFTSSLIVNYHTIKRDRTIIFTMILLPIVAIALLSKLCSVDKYKDNAEREFPAFIPFNSLEQCLRYHNLLAYSPHGMEFFFLNHLRKKIRIDHFQVNDLQQELRTYQDQHLLLAIVEFSEAAQVNSIPEKWNIKIRFPPYLRRIDYSNEPFRTWMTTRKFHLLVNSPPEVFFDDPYSSLPGYYQEGFLGLMNAIWESIIQFQHEIKIRQNEPGMFPLERPIPKMTMQAFTQPIYTGTPFNMRLIFISRLIYIIAPIYLICFLLICKHMSKGQENYIYMYCFVNTANPYAVYLSWVAIASVITFILAHILTLGLKFPIFTGGVFANSSYLIVSCLLWLFGIANSLSTYPIARMTGSVHEGLCDFILIYFISAIPYVEISHLNKTWIIFFMVLSPLCSLAIAFDILLVMENFNIGCTLQNASQAYFPMSGIYLTETITCTFCHIALQLVVGYITDIICVEHNVSILTSLRDRIKILMERRKNIYNYEAAALADSYILVAYNLNKKFGKSHPLKNITLVAAAKEIVLISGHNGSGKTTLIDTLVGFYIPTSGYLYFDKMNVMYKVTSRNIGFCPQHPGLLQNLTVIQHIIFIARLKGALKHDANFEANKYLTLFNMEKLAHFKVSSLSLGLKRKLSIILAFCGNSRFIFLDEPSLFLDPCSFHALLELIKYNKSSATMIITTNNLELFEEVADRIYLLNNGQITFGGTVEEIKNMSNIGMVLEIEKFNYDTDVHQITCYLQNYVPDIEPYLNTGFIVTYLLPDNMKYFMKEFTNKFLKDMANLNIKNFKIDAATLTEYLVEQQEREANIRNRRKPKEINWSKYPRADNSDYTWMHRLMLQFYKQYLFNKYYIVVNIYRFIIPGLLTILALVEYNSSSLYLSPIKMDVSEYPNTKIVLSYNKSDYTGKKIKQFKNYFDHHGIMYDEIEIILTEEYFLLANLDILERNRIICGYFVDKSNVRIYFNSFLYHSSPICLHIYYSTLYWIHKEPYEITIENHPIALRVSPFKRKVASMLFEKFSYGLAVGIYFIQGCSFYTYFEAKVNRVFNMELVTGISKPFYYFSIYLFELTTNCIAFFFMLIPAFIIESNYFPHPINAIYVFQSLLLNFTTIFPIYCILASKSHSKAVIIEAALALYITGFVNLFSVATHKSIHEYLEVPSITFFWVPFYSLLTIFSNLYRELRDYSHCVLSNQLCYDRVHDSRYKHILDYYCKRTVCKYDEKCCDYIGSKNESKYSVSNRYLYLIMIIQALLGFLFFVIYETKIFAKQKFPEDPKNEDENVRMEKRRIRRYNFKLLKNPLLVMKNLTKFYKKHNVVNGICLEVNAFDGIALLGANGSGVSTILGLLSREIPPTFGNVYINGFNIEENFVSKFCGYIPRLRFRHLKIRVRELLAIVIINKGYRFKQRYEIATELATAFHFINDFNKKSKSLSAGHFKLVENALTCIGNCPVLIFDKPSLGLDYQRTMSTHNALIKLRHSGTAIIFKTYDIRETELIATKLAIVVNGNFKCLSKIGDIKTQYLIGFYIVIKSKNFETLPILDYIFRHFENTVLFAHDKDDPQIVFRVLKCECNMNQARTILSHGKDLNLYESYEIIHPTLEHMIFDICSRQKFSDIK